MPKIFAPKELMASLLAGLFVSTSVACAAEYTAPAPRPADKHMHPSTKAKVRAIITVLQDDTGRLVFRVRDQDGKAFEECMLCPPEYVHSAKGEDDRHCDRLAKEHQKQGKTPICLSRSTPIGLATLTIGQNISSDCIWIPFAGTRILINPGCSH